MSPKLEDVGVFSFISYIICFSVLFIISGRFYILYLYSKSFVAISIFIFYFIVNYIIDHDNLSTLDDVTFGTTRGILFAFLLGLTVSFLFSELYKFTSKKRNINLIGFFITFLGFYSIYLGFNLFFSNLEFIRADVFLIHLDGAGYQRPMAFGLVYYIVLCMSISLILTSNYFSRLFKFIQVLIAMIVAIIFIVYSQFIGSNSGSVTVMCIFGVLVLYFFLISEEYFYNQKLTIKNIIFGQIGQNIIIKSFVIGSSIVLTGLLFIYYSQLDLAMFRIFGYGQDKVSSFSSRFEIFQNYFFMHFSYNPLFGNTRVHEIFDTTYVHSLLSIFTHLGLFGFALFIVILFYIYKNILDYDYKYSSFYTDKKLSFLRLLIVTSVLFFALGTTFFTWIPLWFIFGFLGINLPIKNLKG